MSNKRITDLSELTNPTTDDVFPVVDIASNTTTKVQLGNLPVPTSVTTALATKENTITPGTTAQYFRGDKSFQTLDKTAVGLANVDNTSDANKPVSTAQQTALNAKQDTLVSGTNIKTLNSTSLLGSGNIVLTANPSGVSGAIQFSNGSAFASDATNLFWDDTNNRLGIRTNSPTATTHIVGVDQLTTSTSLLVQDSVGGNILRVHNSANNSAVVMSTAKIADYDIVSGNVLSNTQMRFVPTTGGIAVNKDYSFAASNTLVHLKGSGSTSATTSLLVQNSAGAQLFKVDDGGNVQIGSANGGVTFNAGYNNAFYQNQLSFYSTNTNIRGINAGGQGLIISKNSGTSDLYPTALLAIDSTTQGFLPPRMTTTQKNAIATPAAGLVIYDNTTNKLQCYNGSTWNDLF